MVFEKTTRHPFWKETQGPPSEGRGVKKKATHTIKDPEVQASSTCAVAGCVAAPSIVQVTARIC